MRQAVKIQVYRFASPQGGEAIICSVNYNKAVSALKAVTSLPFNLGKSEAVPDISMKSLLYGPLLLYPASFGAVILYNSILPF